LLEDSALCTNWAWAGGCEPLLKDATRTLGQDHAITQLVQDCIQARKVYARLKNSNPGLNRLYNLLEPSEPSETKFFLRYPLLDRKFSGPGIQVLLTGHRQHWLEYFRLIDASSATPPQNP
jgi:hypothetical protein